MSMSICNRTRVATKKMADGWSCFQEHVHLCSSATEGGQLVNIEGRTRPKYDLIGARVMNQSRAKFRVEILSKEYTDILR